MSIILHCIRLFITITLLISLYIQRVDSMRIRGIFVMKNDRNKPTSSNDSSARASTERRTTTKSTGFGSPIKSKTDGRNKQANSGTSKLSMEQMIQNSISETPGLREAMNSYASKPLGGASTNDQDSSWTQTNIHNRLHEITWDTSASFRDSRHQEQTVSSDMEIFLFDLSRTIIDSSIKCSATQNIYDIGCGTGILLKYIKKYCITTGISFDERRFYGIDLSNEMIKIASKHHPLATFTKGDFMNYKPSTAYSVIIFNESLHNFIDIRSALLHASTLIERNGSIIVSNPRGYDSIVTQNKVNKWLAPSVLPTVEEWESLLVGEDMHLKLAVAPDVRSSHYLAVLSVVRNID